jgi:excisionase family DNA binding protein
MLTTKQAGERLGIRPRSVVNLIRAGRIVAEKAGRDYLIADEEVARYEQDRRPAHRPTKPRSEG